MEHKILKKILPQEFTGEYSPQEVKTIGSDGTKITLPPEFPLISFLGQAWTKKDREQRSPYICELTAHFNHVSTWVQSEILTVANVKQSARVAARFLDLCQVKKKGRKSSDFKGETLRILGLGGLVCWLIFYRSIYLICKI